MDTTGYTYTSTTTDAYGNVVSETKKSSTKTGGTEKIEHVKKYPYITYYVDNKALDQKRYPGDPGIVEERGNSISVMSLEPGKNIKKDSGVLNMSERDFSYLDYLSKHNPTSQEDFRKGVFKAYNKDVKSGKPWTAGELKDAIKDIKFKADKNKLARHSYAGSKLDPYGNLKLGEKIGNVISGDASCGDMSQTFISPTVSNPNLGYPVNYRKNLFGNIKATYRADKPYISFDYDKLLNEDSKADWDEYNNLVSSVTNNPRNITEDDLRLATNRIALNYPNSKLRMKVRYPNNTLTIRSKLNSRPQNRNLPERNLGQTYTGLDVERISDWNMATPEQIEEYWTARENLLGKEGAISVWYYKDLPSEVSKKLNDLDDRFHDLIVSNKENWQL